MNQVLSKELLNILACPLNKKPLQIVPKGLLKKVNEEIQRKKCYTLSDEIIKTPLTHALYEPESGTLYRIEDGIPVLLQEEAIRCELVGNQL